MQPPDLAYEEFGQLFCIDILVTGNKVCLLQKTVTHDKDLVKSIGEQEFDDKIVVNLFPWSLR